MATEVKEPTHNWYWRVFGSESIVGPWTFYEADQTAREVSDEPDTPATELLTKVYGNFMVVAIYVRGTKRVQGKRARDASRLGLPPIE